MDHIKALDVDHLHQVNIPEEEQLAIKEYIYRLQLLLQDVRKCPLIRLCHGQAG